MKRFSLAFVLVLAASAPALAQTLAVDVVAQAPPAQPAPIEIVAQSPPQAAPVVAAPRPERAENDAPAPYAGLTLWGEQMDLSGSELTFRHPEIRSLTGLVLDPEWAGQRALREQPLGGMSVAIGMRGFEFLRGPELRLMFGGGDIDSDYMPTPMEGIDVALRRALTFRVEMAVGLQVPLGPVVPYVLARAAVGGVWIDVGVRDARLGELGTETLDMTTLELGMEAGLGFRVGEGVELGVAFRGSFLGNESLGAMASIGLDASTFER